MPVKCLAFDAFGTLFSLEGVRPRMYEVVGARELDLYQRFQLRLAPYNWYCNSMPPSSATERYSANIYAVGESVIRQAADELGLDVSAAAAEYISEALGTLPLFPGIIEALDDLKNKYPLAVLTNGTPECLTSLLQNSGIADRFQHVLSVKSAGYFKPAAEVYHLAPAAFQVSPEEVALVSANDWDTAAAQMAGLKGVWISRKRRITTIFGVTPDFVVEELKELSQLLERNRGNAA